MRILQVAAAVAPRYGGPSGAVLGLSRGLASAGHTVQLVTLSLDGKRNLDVVHGALTEYEGVPTRFYRAYPPRTIAYSGAAVVFLLKHINEYDIVHIHSLYLGHSSIAARVARRAGVPYVVRPHGTLTRHQRSINRGRKAAWDATIARDDLRGAAWVHCTSAVEVEEYRDLRNVAPAKLLPLGIEIPGPAADLCPPRWWPSSEFVVTFLGRLALKKHPEALVQAVALLRVHGVDVTAVIAGPDDDWQRNTLASLAADLKIRDFIVLPGLITGRERDYLLRHGSVMVLPSDDENFGNSVLESIAYGTPVAITPGVALSAELLPAQAAIPLSSTSGSAVASALEAVLAVPSCLDEIRRRGLSLAENHFAWSVLVDRYLDAYRGGP